MSSTQLFLIWLLLIMWLITCAALVVCLRRYIRSATARTDLPLDFISSLISQSQFQTEYAWNLLIQVTDALKIGLIARKRAGLDSDDTLVINSCAGLITKAIDDWGEDGKDLFDSVPVSGSRCLFVGKKAIQIRRLNLVGTDFLLLEDVSDTLEMARKLKDAERLGLLGKMSGHIAHQLKTPLAILGTKAQLLARALKDRPELQDRAQEIFNEATGIAARINSIVSVYKEAKPVLERVELRPLFLRIKDRLDAEKSDVDIVVDCADNVFVYADCRILEDLLFLLGQNALDEQVNASKLVLQAGPESSNRVAIYVIDDGVGIPYSIREHLFDPFVGKSQNGLGLGLFLARDLAMRLNGSLNLENSQKGTVFCLVIPAAG